MQRFVKTHGSIFSDSGALHGRARPALWNLRLMRRERKQEVTVGVNRRRCY